MSGAGKQGLEDAENLPVCQGLKPRSLRRVLLYHVYSLKSFFKLSASTFDNTQKA